MYRTALSLPLVLGFFGLSNVCLALLPRHPGPPCYICTRCRLGTPRMHRSLTTEALIGRTFSQNCHEICSCSKPAAGGPRLVYNTYGVQQVVQTRQTRRGDLLLLSLARGSLFAARYVERVTSPPGFCLFLLASTSLSVYLLPPSVNLALDRGLLLFHTRPHVCFCHRLHTIGAVKPDLPSSPFIHQSFFPSYLA